VAIGTNRGGFHAARLGPTIAAQVLELRGRRLVSSGDCLVVLLRLGGKPRHIERMQMKVADNIIRNCWTNTSLVSLPIGGIGMNLVSTLMPVDVVANSIFDQVQGGGDPRQFRRLHRD